MTPAPTFDAGPVQSAQRRQLNLDRPRALGKVLALAVPGGLLSRWAFGGTLGLGFTVWTAALLGGFAWAAGREGRHQARRAAAWAVAALFFAAMVAVRDEAALTAFNVIATFGLLALAARDTVSAPPRARLVDFGRSALQTSVGAIKGAVVVSNEAVRRAVELKQRAPGSVGSLLRGLLYATPVLGILTTLLMSGDKHFKAALSGATDSLPELVLTATDWGFWSVLTGLCVAGLQAFALRRRRADLEATGGTDTPGWQLGAIEGLVVLGSVVVLFATFLTVQATYLFWQDPSARGTGLTYAAYAREGFAQLTVVAALTWWLVEFSRRHLSAQSPGQDLAVRIAGSLVLSQALVILVSAHVRLALYDEVYGLTATRLFAHAGISFLGLCLLARLVTLWVARQATANLVAASGIAVLTALNVLNPDATVVRANLSRHANTIGPDWRYLASLSADAAPALGPLLTSLPAAVPPSDDTQYEEYALQRWVCRQHADSVAAWNLGRARALAFESKCNAPLLTLPGWDD